MLSPVGYDDQVSWSISGRPLCGTVSLSPHAVHICTGNSREETPLFRAVQFGNMAWVQGLLERGANPRLAFVPNDRDEHHVERYKTIYKLLDNYRGEALSTEREQRNKFRKGKKTTDVRALCTVVCQHLDSGSLAERVVLARQSLAADA